jgi:hypothetical protein
MWFGEKEGKERQTVVIDQKASLDIEDQWSCLIVGPESALTLKI